MSRSKWKYPFIENSLLKKVCELKQKKQGSVFIKTKSRASMITPDFVGLRLRVYNGKEFYPLVILPEMVGYKVGEFVFTRARYEYKKKKKK